MVSKALEKKHKKRLERSEKVKLKKQKVLQSGDASVKAERFRQGRLQLTILFIFLVISTVFVITLVH